MSRQLEVIGNTLPESFAGSSQPHVRAAIAQWQQRAQRLCDDFLAYSIGLDAERLAALKKLIPLDSVTNEANTQSEPIYLAAARMVRHHRQIAQVMQRLQQAPATGKQPFAAKRSQPERGRGKSGAHAPGQPTAGSVLIT